MNDKIRELTEKQVEDIHRIIERHSTDIVDYEGAADDVNAYLFGGVEQPESLTEPAPVEAVKCPHCGSTRTVSVGGGRYVCHAADGCPEEFEPFEPAPVGEQDAALERLNEQWRVRTLVLMGDIDKMKRDIAAAEARGREQGFEQCREIAVRKFQGMQIHSVPNYIDRGNAIDTIRALGQPPAPPSGEQGKEDWQDGFDAGRESEAAKHTDPVKWLEDAFAAYKILLKVMYEKRYNVAAARTEGFEQAREMAADISEGPYYDNVGAYGSDEPSTVGKKIATAIRALGQPAATASKVSTWGASEALTVLPPAATEAKPPVTGVVCTFHLANLVKKLRESNGYIEDQVADEIEEIMRTAGPACGCEVVHNIECPVGIAQRKARSDG